MDGFCEIMSKVTFMIFPEGTHGEIHERAFAGFAEKNIWTFFHFFSPLL